MNPTQADPKSKLIFNCQPFRAWRYNTQRVKMSDVIAPPYDVISPEKQQKFYEKSPHNVIRLILNKKEPADTDANNNYTRARDFLMEWQKKGILTREDEPCFYVYRQTFTDPLSGQQKHRFALLGRVKLEPFEKGIIIPHEKTLKGPREDRMKLLRMVKTNLSPIFGLYKDDGFEVRGLIQDPINSKSLFEAGDDDGILHTLWAISDSDIVSKLHKAMSHKKVYIADGHHRYETALAYAQQLREEMGVPQRVIMPFEFVYMALVSFDDPGFIVLPTHRIVSDLGMDGREAVRKLQEYFKVEPAPIEKIKEITEEQGKKNMTFGLLLRDEGTFLLTMIDKEKARGKMVRGKPPVWYDLNVNVLGHLIFSELLHIPETRWESLLKFEHTVEGTVELAKKTGAHAAFFLSPPKVEMLEKMGAVGERMPQKSTYFYPKLATGLVFYSHTD